MKIELHKTLISILKMNKIALKASLSDGVEVDCVLSYSTETQATLNIAIDNQYFFAATSSDLFEALKEIRKNLEPKGIKILCNGSRIDTYPSRMSRDMSKAFRIYVHKKSKNASIKDLVNIFDPAEKNLISTIAEQEKFFQDWASMEKQ